MDFNKRIILLCGRKTTGKDTSALIIKEYLSKHGVSSEIKSFADPLKELSINILGCNRSEMYGPSEKRNCVSPVEWKEISQEFIPEHIDNSVYMTNRDVLTIVGTNVLRRFMNNIWARAAYVAALNSHSDVVIFSDTRFPNEIEVFTEAYPDVDITSIRLYRDSGSLLNHVSDSALDIYDEKLEQVRLPNIINLRDFVDRRTYQVFSQRLWKPLNPSSKFDWLLDNNGSLDELATNLKLICNTSVL